MAVVTTGTSCSDHLVEAVWSHISSYVACDLVGMTFSNGQCKYTFTLPISQIADKQVIVLAWPVLTNTNGYSICDVRVE